MARGSKNIKPKRNKTVRSSKRARKKHPDKMKKKFTNEAVKQNWDPRKTVKQVREAMQCNKEKKDDPFVVLTTIDSSTNICAELCQVRFRIEPE